MSKTLYQCNKCLKGTPLVKKKETIFDGIVHEFAECQQCGYKSTFYYSDNELRALLFRQSHTRNRKKKVELAKEIQIKIDTLMSIYGKQGAD